MWLRKRLRACIPDRLVQALRFLIYGNPSNPTVGMISMNERDFYSRCAGKFSDVGGAIVDLGCWMGATTASLAQGLQQNDRAASKGMAKIYAFDRFVWESWMDFRLKDVFCHYLPGECFLPEVRRNLRQYSDVVQLVKADLKTYVWDDGPIGILLVDAMKSRELTRTIAMAFFPYLPRGGILIHQDFKHYYTPWIHILQYRLRDDFRVLENVPESGTLAFETLQVVSSDAADKAVDFEHMSDREVEDALTYSLSLVGKEGKEEIAAAHVMYFVHGKRKQKSLEVFSQYRTEGIRVVGEFKVAKQQIDRLEQ